MWKVTAGNNIKGNFNGKGSVSFGAVERKWQNAIPLVQKRRIKRRSVSVSCHLHKPKPAGADGYFESADRAPAMQPAKPAGADG